MESLAEGALEDACNSSWGGKAKLWEEKIIELSLEEWISVKQSPALEGHSKTQKTSRDGKSRFHWHSVG